MDDDVLELTRKCAAALGLDWDSDDRDVWLGTDEDATSYAYVPHLNDAQAFELLCWLREHVELHILDDGLRMWDDKNRSHYFDAPTPAELRLALMRATVKVHEGRGK